MTSGTMTSYQSKPEALRAFLDKGLTMIHLDARCDGVVVPRQFVGQRDLRLNLSYRFSGSAMDIDEQRVEATLTFGGMPFRCRIPLLAVYALTSQVTGAGLVFPESLPAELVSELKRQMSDDNSDLTGEVYTSEPTSAEGIVQDMDADLLFSENRSENKTARPARRRREGRPTSAPHLRVIDGAKK